MKTLIPVLGDQLSHQISSLSGQDKSQAILLMVEVADETAYVPHHKAKLAYILSAMRHHARDLQGQGWDVDYVRLTDPMNCGNFTGEIVRAMERHCPQRIRVTEAGEWRVKAMLDS